MLLYWWSFECMIFFSLKWLKHLGSSKIRRHNLEWHSDLFFRHCRESRKEFHFNSCSFFGGFLIQHYWGGLSSHGKFPLRSRSSGLILLRTKWSFSLYHMCAKKFHLSVENVHWSTLCSPHKTKYFVENRKKRAKKGLFLERLWVNC